MTIAFAAALLTALPLLDGIAIVDPTQAGEGVDKVFEWIYSKAV